MANGKWRVVGVGLFAIHYSLFAMKLAVFAYHDVGYECLKVLTDLKEEIVAVVTHEDDPVEEVWFRSVAELARSRGLAVYTPESPNRAEFVEIIRKLAPDLILSFYYRRLLSQQLLEIPRLGGVNLHGSLLPKYRGRVPVNWAIINGETETGVTLHYMIEEADAGDIIAQRRVAIDEGDTARDLYGKIVAAGAALLSKTWPLIKEGRAPRIPQDSRLATKFGARRPEDGKIVWDSPARSVYNLVRAVTRPYPGAFTFWKGRKLYIWQARLGPMVNGSPRGVGEAATPRGKWSTGKEATGAGHEAMGNIGAPGTVLNAEIGRGLWVRAGDGPLLLTRAQFEGAEEMPADDLAGQHGIQPGTRLG